jgi:hypothetical protein
MRQSQLASLVFRDRTTLVHIEKGRARADEQFWAVADDAVKAGGALVRAFRELEAAKHAHEQQLRTTALAEASHSLPFDLCFGTMPPSVNGRPADAEYVESIRHTNQALVRLDTIHGGNDILPLVLQVFQKAHQKVSTGAYEPAVERDLIAATGESGEIAAWLAYDADRQAVSRQIVHEALMLSRQAGDRDMELFELTHLAMQSVYLHRPAEALRIADDLVDGGILAPRVTALFAIRRGRALAQLGDQQRAFAALDSARSAVSDGTSPRDPQWTWWINETEVMWHRAMAHADLGQWPHAVPLLFEVAAKRHPAYRRAWYNDQVHLLNALVHVADWREAEPVIAEVATQVGDIGSTRTTNLLRRIVGRLGRTDTPSTVADTAADLRRHLSEQTIH